MLITIKLIIKNYSIDKNNKDSSNNNKNIINSNNNIKNANKNININNINNNNNNTTNSILSPRKLDEKKLNLRNELHSIQSLSLVDG